VLSDTFPKSTLFPYTTLFRSQRLNITKKGISITEVLEQIKSQSGDDYFFNESAIRADHRIDIDLKQASLADVLNYSLKDLPRSRSEEHTSELQSRENLVCRLL